MKGLLVFALVGLVLATGFAFPLTYEEDTKTNDELGDMQEDFLPLETEL